MSLPKPVNPMLVTATSTAQHRLLVFRVCDGGYCSSDTYLQWLHEYPPKVIHTAPVPELGEGHVVTSTRWVRNRERPMLVVVVDPRHLGGPPMQVFITPAEPGFYHVGR